MLRGHDELESNSRMSLRSYLNRGLSALSAPARFRHLPIVIRDVDSRFVDGVGRGSEAVGGA